MQITIYDKIKSLITALPERDLSLGNKFLKERNFDSLQELAESALVKTKRNLRKENPKEEYLKVDLDNLIQLILEVNLYRSYIEGDNTEE